MAVVTFARATGDLDVLSRTDVRLIALARTLEAEAHGTAHLRAAPPPLVLQAKAGRTGAAQNPPGWGAVPNPEDWEGIDLVRDDGRPCRRPHPPRRGRPKSDAKAVAAAQLQALEGKTNVAVGASTVLLRDEDDGEWAAAVSNSVRRRQQRRAARQAQASLQAEAEAAVALSNPKPQAELATDKAESCQSGAMPVDLLPLRVGTTASATTRDDVDNGKAATEADAEPEDNSSGVEEENDETACEGGGSKHDESWWEEEDDDEELEGGGASAGSLHNEAAECPPSEEVAEQELQALQLAQVEGAAVSCSSSSSIASMPWESSVACATTDFAMQNVILQMGLRLVADNGMRIKKVQRWGLKCQACNAVTTERGRLFCPKCGNGGTLHRVSMTVGEDGVLQAGVRKRFSLRGTRYSLPLPVGGRKGQQQNPILMYSSRSMARTHGSRGPAQRLTCL
eukprot:SM000001S04469  [mRNA]  locus=s1:337134:338969:- [translate_table: standard]